MRHRNVNRGKIWGVLNAACTAWGLPGLSACVRVYFRHRIFSATSPPWTGRNVQKFAAVGKCLPLQATILLQREHWIDDPKDRNDTLVHEMAHFVECLRYGKTSHGRRHRALMKSGLRAVKKAGIHA